jgi:chromosome segregation protein
VFLRSLSMRGFKSFADRTVLEVEPGITVIVGPNGSGKSNVVDALSWVLGTHSAKKVRGGSMSDVIFAGSPTRQAAGRAHVEIVIDNSAGQLSGTGLGTAHSAAQFSEVRVSRTIHSDGETSYRINGEEVRALDVQELLSDTGLGRELHTIVGQGQLDEILNAKPEERRRYIEEAASVRCASSSRSRATSTSCARSCASCADSCGRSNDRPRPRTATRRYRPSCARSPSRSQPSSCTG